MTFLMTVIETMVIGHLSLVLTKGQDCPCNIFLEMCTLDVLTFEESVEILCSIGGASFLLI